MSRLSPPSSLRADLMIPSSFDARASSLATARSRSASFRGERSSNSAGWGSAGAGGSSSGGGGLERPSLTTGAFDGEALDDFGLVGFDGRLSDKRFSGLPERLAETPGARRFAGFSAVQLR